MGNCRVLHRDDTVIHKLIHTINISYLLENVNFSPSVFIDILQQKTQYKHPGHSRNPQKGRKEKGYPIQPHICSKALPQKQQAPSSHSRYRQMKEYPQWL